MGYRGWECAAVCIFLIVAVYWWSDVCWWRLAAERKGENFATFRASFDADTSVELLRSVYALCQSWTSVADFPVLADDNLAEVYAREELDFDDAVLDLLKEFGRVPPPSEDPPVVATVRDLVLFVTACPPANPI